jgi:hypothetical protein
MVKNPNFTLVGVVHELRHAYRPSSQTFHGCATDAYIVFSLVRDYDDFFDSFDGLYDTKLDKHVRCSEVGDDGRLAKRDE